MDIVPLIGELFDQHGHRRYEGAREEPVTALAHALQCAQFAEWAEASPALVVASLLHDIGHLVVPDPAIDSIDDAHELRALGLLAAHFDADVIEPIRLHVQAKRFLVAVDPRYGPRLSPASAHTLQLQGGAMSRGEIRLFEARPYASQAVALRRWDDLAKEPGRKTPPLAYYLELVDAVRRGPDGSGDARRAIGARDIA